MIDYEIRGLFFPFFVKSREHRYILGPEVSEILESSLFHAFKLPENKKEFLMWDLFGSAVCICRHLFLDPHPAENLEYHLEIAPLDIEPYANKYEYQVLTHITIWGILSLRKGNTTAIDSFIYELEDHLEAFFQQHEVADRRILDFYMAAKRRVTNMTEKFDIDFSPEGFGTDDFNYKMIEDYFNNLRIDYYRKFYAECMLRICNTREEQQRLCRLLLQKYPELHWKESKTPNGKVMEAIPDQSFDPSIIETIQRGEFHNYMTLGATGHPTPQVPQADQQDFQRALVLDYLKKEMRRIISTGGKAKAILAPYKAAVDMGLIEHITNKEFNQTFNTHVAKSSFSDYFGINPVNKFDVRIVKQYEDNITKQLEIYYQSSSQNSK